MAKDNKSLGNFQLTGIEPAPRGIPQIEITFNIDANGMLNVTAKDLKTNKEANITIKNSGALSEEEIDKMIKDAEANKEQDQKNKEHSELRYKAESYINMIEKTMQDPKLAANINEKQKEESKKMVDELKDLLAKEKWDELKTKLTAIDSIMAQFANAAKAQTNKDNATKKKDDKKQ